MIDWARVDELKSEIGDDGFAEIAELFLEEIGEVLNRIRATGTSTDVRGDLHFVKGSAMNLGFRELANLCGAGEVAHGKGDKVDLIAIADSFDRAAETFKTKLAA